MSQPAFELVKEPDPDPFPVERSKLVNLMNVVGSIDMNKRTDFITIRVTPELRKNWMNILSRSQRVFGNEATNIFIAELIHTLSHNEAPFSAEEYINNDYQMQSKQSDTLWVGEVGI